MKLPELDWPDIATRFKRLYTPAVCDVLDEYELRHQYVHHSIRPLDRTLMLAGPAFTIVGMANSTRDRTKRMGPRVIDSFVPHVVACYDTMGEEQTGVWGELWSAGAAKRGCVGAVVDGGIRDTAYIRRAKFPIFHKFTMPGDAVGRFNIVDFGCPVSIGGVRVAPGDYVFGDEDGVVMIPKALTLEVLAKAEAVCAKENKIRDAIEDNASLADLYVKFEKF
jgi:4-hydroxy-4-methyl-2-oxoglutarate aldolase